MICECCNKRPKIKFSNLCHICNSIAESETIELPKHDIVLENERIEFFSITNMSFEEALKYL